MGFRFRKRIRIAPGLAINISKSGVSTSIGGKGSTINIGKAILNVQWLQASMDAPRQYATYDCRKVK